MFICLSLPGDDVLRWLLFLFAGYFSCPFFPFHLLSLFCFVSDRVAGLIWFSVYLVTRAGFVADELRQDKQQQLKQQQMLFPLCFWSTRDHS